MAKDFDFYLELMKENVSDLDTSEGSVVDGIFRAVAYALASAQQELQGFAEIAFPEDGSGAYLDARAADVGLTRKAGAKATASVILSGSVGAVVPAGTALQTVGGLTFRTLSDATIEATMELLSAPGEDVEEIPVLEEPASGGSGGLGSATVRVEAEKVGAIYNVSAGEISIMQTATMAVVENSSSATGGTDAESDAALLQRLHAYLRHPPASCNAAQYISWATSVDGIGFAKVIPKPNGVPYAVKLALVDDEMLPVTQAKADEVKAFIDTVREVNVEVTVVPATSRAIPVAATVTLAADTTTESVQNQLEALLAAYFQEIARSGGAVLYHRIEYLLLSIPGVVDVSSLSVDGGTVNITPGEDAVPVVGTVAITC